jgi:predicted KAP-like P-loop ATPase
MTSIKIECFFSSHDEKKKLIILNKIKKTITANYEKITHDDNQYSFVIKKLIPNGNILFLMQYKFAKR